MFYDFIICRSLTYAQRTARVLERAGIWAGIVRTPRNLSPTGCGYSVRVPQGSLPASIELLERMGLPVKAAFSADGLGGYQEVEL